MPFTDALNPEDAGRAQAPDPAQNTARSLDMIENILHRMLALAELSASDLQLDRNLLQKTLDHLKNEIDSIADQM